MYRTSFQFDLGAFSSSTDTLNQDCNIDYPTYKTAEGLQVSVSSLLGGPVLLLIGSMKGSDLTEWQMYKHARLGSTNHGGYEGERSSLSAYKFTWDYTTRSVRVVCRNLAATADTFYMTIKSGDA